MTTGASDKTSVRCAEGSHKPPSRAAASVLKRILAVPEVGILLPLAAFALLFYALNPLVLSGGNLVAMLKGMSFVGIIVVGEALLLVVGELDLSVGSTAGLCAIVAAWMMKVAGWPVGGALAAGVAAGALVGLVNGAVAVRIGVPAFITTLGMLYIAKGMTYLISRGYPIDPLPQCVVDFGKAELWGISWSLVIFAAVAIMGDVALRFTVFGRMIYATGGNREVARIAGINTSAVKIICYVVTGCLVAVAGILTMADLRVGQPEIGVGWELDAIASVVIGGVSLFGGMGTIAGAVLGLLTMQVVKSGLSGVHLDPHWQTVAVGVIMIAAVSFDLLRRRAKMH